MVYKKFVQVGRVAHVSTGPNAGKLVTIVDIIDANRGLVDGPCTGVKRQAMNFNQLYLTKFLLKMQHSAGTKSLKKLWEKAEISQKFAETTWAKKMEARKKRMSMSDFERFQLYKAKQARNKILNREIAKLTAKDKPLRPKKFSALVSKSGNARKTVRNLIAARQRPTRVMKKDPKAKATKDKSKSKRVEKRKAYVAAKKEGSKKTKK